MSIFEKATRLQVRFETSKGLVTTEDLWSLPLTSTRNQPNLDDICVGLARQLKNSIEFTSYVNPAANADSSEAQLRFDVVKHIIDVRVAERDKAHDAAKRKETKQRILEIIASKKDEALRGQSIEDLTNLANSLET